MTTQLNLYIGGCDKNKTKQFCENHIITKYKVYPDNITQGGY